MNFKIFISKNENEYIGYVPFINKEIRGASIEELKTEAKSFLILQYLTQEEIERAGTIYEVDLSEKDFNNEGEIHFVKGMGDE